MSTTAFLLVLVASTVAAVAATVSFFVYDNTSFPALYSRCNNSGHSPLGQHGHSYQDKHSVDALFLRDVLDPAWSGGHRVADPSLAEIFIIPVLCSQAIRFCGWPDTFQSGASHLVFGQLSHLKVGVRDHLIICDDFKACTGNREWPFEFIVGCFEAYRPNRIAVGYSTSEAARQLNGKIDFPEADITLNLKRKYKLVFAGQRDSRPAYRYRMLLCDDVINTSVPLDFLICKQRTLLWGPRGVGKDSLVILSLPGDTSTTDRIFNAFDSLSIVAALSHDKTRLLANLPFHFAVPWEDLILWIDSTEFERSPLQSLVDAVNGMSEADTHRRLSWTSIFKKEVTWTGLYSRASQNIIEAGARARISNASITTWTWL